MNQKEANSYMSLGLNTGVFIISSILADGLEISPKVAELIKAYVSAEVEKACGMPAEDFAGSVGGLVDNILEMTRKAGEK